MKLQRTSLLRNPAFALRYFLAFACALYCFSDVIFAQGLLQGSHLSIGSGHTIGSNANGAIGYENEMAGQGSFAIGAGVLMPSETYFCLGVGNVSIFEGFNYTQLMLGDFQSTRDSGYSMVAGYMNLVECIDSSIVVGWNNYVSGGVDYTWASIVAGTYNVVSELHQMLVVGSGNAVQTATSGAAIGDGLVNAETNHVVVGKFNKPAASGSAPAFTVANGTGTESNQKSNAFVVYHNGDVVIKKAQGDILMGEFGN